PFGPPPLAAARVTSIARTPGNVTVEFTTAPRCLYYLQWSDDLVHWTTIPGVIRGTGGLMRCVESGNVPRRFYRTMVIR
ncbi:MAG TPA: hypothetical protein VNT99_00020, partial [Methylomirabilota bacterium]|nr:hypothetical protein [Methylomirabilota bacterium]